MEKNTIKQRFEEEVNQQQKKRSKAMAKRTWKVIAVILLIVGVCVYAVDEWRVGVSNFFRDIEDAIMDPIEKKREEEFMKKQLEGDPISSYSAGNITLNYIPDGYCLIGQNIKEAEHISYTTFEFMTKDGNNTITFHAIKHGSNYQSSIDTEDAVITEFEEDGYKVIKSIKGRAQILMWYNDQYEYTLICDIGEEELLKIAKNLNFKNFE